MLSHTHNLCNCKRGPWWKFKNSLPENMKSSTLPFCKLVIYKRYSSNLGVDRSSCSQERPLHGERAGWVPEFSGFLGVGPKALLKAPTCRQLSNLETLQATKPMQLPMGLPLASTSLKRPLYTWQEDSGWSEQLRNTQDLDHVLIWELVFCDVLQFPPISAGHTH